MTDSPIQPMTTGEIIAQAFRLFRANIALLVMVALLPQLGLLAVQYGVTALAEASKFLLPSLLLMTVIAKAITLSAITTVVAGAAVGFPPTLVQTYSLTFRNRLAWVIVGNVLTAFLASLGLFFFIFPWLILGGYMAATVPIIVLESKSPFAAIGRSFALMRNDLPKAIAIFGFVILVSEVFPLLLLVTLGIGPLSPVLAVVVGAVTLPLAYSANAILYFSMRAGEGYTVDTLNEELHSRVSGKSGSGAN